ncbi:uncharacterized protein LOC110987653 [Acanthaster planci]|uniref:Uncharacterized protein LOC110987653 n=1 Tax=Acanthaster planci TaxID=133434 RepID=A0A8B7ZKV6_ACAPL|nr:uncharacterized protein LOC110987653 [Acanthaster planci]
MFTHSLLLLLLAGGLLNLAAEIGYYEGGTIFWEARNPDNPLEITVNFEFKFDASKKSYTHNQCTQEAIDTHKKLRTGGSFQIESDFTGADYYCTHLKDGIATGVYTLTHMMPEEEATAEINYEECCWIPSILNNAQIIRSGKGWNLVSKINTKHKDGVSINSPPQSKAFTVFSIMSGCTYRIHIANVDANDDIVKCRWASEMREECNENAGDLCGQPYFDAAKSKPLATWDQGACELVFGEGDPIPSGSYALMVMLEDYASVESKEPMSKTPLHLLIDVFRYDGECRKPDLNVPRLCFYLVLGQEFRRRMVATATSSNYRITSIKVDDYSTDTPTRVPGTTSDYEIVFRFTPTQEKTYIICAVAVEEERFVSSQSCCSVTVVRTEPEALRVDKINSIPAENSQEAEAIVPNWAIKFNREIQQGVFSPAYVTLRDSSNALIWRVDATGPDAVVVNGDTLTFPNSHEVFLDFKTEYTISLDEGVVQSAEGQAQRKCTVKSKPAEWSFVPKQPEQKVPRLTCSVSSMNMLIPTDEVDLGGHGPEIMHLRDPRCRGSRHNDTYHRMWTSYGMCGTTFQRNGTDYTYSNIIYIPEKPYSPAGTEVTRAPHKEIRFSCNIPAKTIKTLPYNPSLPIIEYQVFNGRANFLDALTDNSLKLFDASYSQPYKETSSHPLDVTFDTRLYFQGKARCSGGRNCHASFESCWATTSENPYSWPRHELINEWCEADETLQLHESDVSNKVRFSVGAFAFLGWRIHDTVYVHCNLFVCYPVEDSSECTRVCQTSTITGRESRRDFVSVVSSPGLFWQK